MVSQYIPNPVPQTADALPQFLAAELARIAFSLNDANERVKFMVLYAPPERYEAGDTVFADGTSWKPDGVNGAGKYRRNAGNTAWVFEG